MSTTTLIGCVSLILAAIGLALSRVVTRRVRVTVHRAMFRDRLTFGPECYFVNVTNHSLSREVEITHVWFDTPVNVHVLPAERPLPKRLKVDEVWTTWIRASELAAALTDDAVYRLARVRLSTGRVFRSKADRSMPPFGSVPGGNPPDAPTGTITIPDKRPETDPDDRGIHKKALIDADRAVDLLRKQLAENVEALRFDDPAVYGWRSITQRILEEAFGKPSRQVAQFVFQISFSGQTEKESQERHVQTIADKKGECLPAGNAINTGF